MELVVIGAIAALVVIAIVLFAVWNKRRTENVREHFGEEYDRAEAEHGSRGAVSELASRQKEHDKLDIRPLSPESRARYVQAWRDTQQLFVDDPATAVDQADVLVTAVLKERGYPIETFDQRASLVSVDHPEVVHNYRAGHAISLASRHGEASTEDLRQAMIYHRALFGELLETDDGERAEDAERLDAGSAEHPSASGDAAASRGTRDSNVVDLREERHLS